MTADIELTRAAQNDIFNAYDWYECERLGLGDDFRDAVDAGLAKIAHAPRSFSFVGKGVRRARIERFPYQIFYRCFGPIVLVYAVLHDKRDPSAWRSRTSAGR